MTTNTVTLTNKMSNLYINDYGFLVPSGTIVCYAGSNAPDGWLFCNGQSVSKTTYANLYTTIGDTYGSINNDTFNLPDLSQRFPMGKSNSNTLGEKAGSNSVTLTADKLPLHSHTATSSSNGEHSHTGYTNTTGNHSHSINDPGHTHTQWTINDDFNNSGGSNPSFSADSSGYKTWSNINNSTTGITINYNGDHSHTFTIDSAGSHNHTITIDSTGTTNPSIDITNKYIVLNYIIRY